MSEILQPTIFWFLRHGETDWNARGLSQGNVDIPLNETGIAQAQAAALLMRGKGVASIVSSPLSRARDTANMVGETLGLPVTIEHDLHEVSFGSQEAQPMAGEWFKEWVAGTVTPEGAETFTELRARAVSAINRVLRQPFPVLVVAHGALFRALRAEMGLEPNVKAANAVPMLCSPGPGPSYLPWQLEPAIPA